MLSCVFCAQLHQSLHSKSLVPVLHLRARYHLPRLSGFYVSYTEMFVCLALSLAFASYLYPRVTAAPTDPLVLPALPLSDLNTTDIIYQNTITDLFLNSTWPASVNPVLHLSLLGNTMTNHYSQGRSIPLQRKLHHPLRARQIPRKATPPRPPSKRHPPLPAQFHRTTIPLQKGLLSRPAALRRLQQRQSHIFSCEERRFESDFRAREKGDSIVVVFHKPAE